MADELDSAGIRAARTVEQGRVEHTRVTGRIEAELLPPRNEHAARGLGKQRDGGEAVDMGSCTSRLERVVLVVPVERVSGTAIEAEQQNELLSQSRFHTRWRKRRSEYHLPVWQRLAKAELLAEQAGDAGGAKGLTAVVGLAGLGGLDASREPSRELPSTRSLR